MGGAALRKGRASIDWETRTELEDGKRMNKEAGPCSTNAACCYRGRLCKSSIDRISYERELFSKMTQTHTQLIFACLKTVFLD